MKSNCYKSPMRLEFQLPCSLSALTIDELKEIQILNLSGRMCTLQIKAPMPQAHTIHSLRTPFAPLHCLICSAQQPQDGTSSIAGAVRELATTCYC